MIWRRKVLSKKRIAPLLMVGLLAFVLAFAAGCSDKAATGETLATVEGEKISKDDLYDFLVKASGKEALEALIDEKVITLEAKKEKVEIDDKDIDKELDLYIENAGGEEGLKNVLEQQGLTQDDLKADIVKYLSIRKMVEPRIKITDEAIAASFEENKAMLDQPEQVEASHILVELEDEAVIKEVAQKLKDGGDFAELAKEYSIDGSAESGGELGLFGRGQMVPEFEEKAFSMKVGEISDPVKTQHGYHLIHLTDKKEAKEAVLEDHKEEIKDKLFEEGLQTEYMAWLTEVKENYKIKNELDKEDKKEEKEDEK